MDPAADSDRARVDAPTGSKRMLSQVAEDYLKVIFKLQSHGRVSTNDIAEQLGVSSATVTNTLKRLTQLELVDYIKYKGVQLTESGNLVALEIIRHHRLLETYLRNVMGFSWSEMHREAERLEHHISEEFEERIDEMLGFPTHDPHGHPIPSKNLVMAESPTQTLEDVPVGGEVTIHHVEDGDVAFLELIEKEGLLPQRAVRVDEHADGALTVTVENGQRTIDSDVARRIFVNA